MTEFLSDQPIVGDSTSPDLLNREEYVERISSAILLERDLPSIVVSIEGPWGTGKTSILNLIQKEFEKLQDDKNPIIFNFNPWLIGKTEDLVQKFLIQFASALSLVDHSTKIKNAVEQILSFSKILSSAIQHVPQIDPKTQAISKLFSAFSEKTMVLIGKLNEFNIDERRDKLIKALSAIDKSIIVFIDDIDRLPPSEVLRMLRLIKAVADFPRVTFLLAFDPVYIEQAMVVADVKDARKYLDKLVQVRLHLPLISNSDLEKIVNVEFDKLSIEKFIDQFPDDKKRLAEFYQLAIKHLIKSPRDIKRIFNRFRFSLKAAKGEVSIADLFALETIAIKAPKIYEHIRTNPLAYIGTAFTEPLFNLDGPQKTVRRYDNERQILIEELPSEEHVHIKEILDKLFPLIEENGREYDERYFRSHGRVAIADRLNITMTFGLPRDEVPLSFINEFVSSDRNRQTIVDEILSTKRLKRFLDYLLYNRSEIKVVNEDDFISKLVQLVESDEAKFLNRYRSDFISIPIVRQIWLIIRNVIDKKNEIEHSKILEGLFSDHNNLTISSECLYECLNEHGFFNDESKIKDKKEKFCSVELLTVLKEKWLNNVSVVFQNDSFDRFTGKSRIVHLLPKLNKQLAIDLIASSIGTNKGLDKFVLAIGPAGQDSDKGTYAQVSQEFLDSVGGAKLIKNRVKERIESAPINNPDLNTIYQSIMTGKRIYYIDNTEADQF